MQRSGLIPVLLIGAIVLACPVVALAAGGGGVLPVSPDLHEIVQLGEGARTYKVMLIIYQFSALLIAAKVLGWLVEKVHVPGVIGELLAGCRHRPIPARQHAEGSRPWLLGSPLPASVKPGSVADQRHHLVLRHVRQHRAVVHGRAAH